MNNTLTLNGHTVNTTGIVLLSENIRLSWERKGDIESTCRAVGKRVSDEEVLPSSQSTETGLTRNVHV